MCEAIHPKEGGNDASHPPPKMEEMTNDGGELNGMEKGIMIMPLGGARLSREYCEGE